MLSRSVLLAALVLAPAATRAEAPDPDRVRARNHLQAGISYYDEGRYDEAAREIATAYRIKPLAPLQYNLAQCYERLGRLGEAIEAYHKYLDGSPGAEDRPLVDRRIKSLQRRVDAAEAARASAPPAEPPPAPEEKVVLKTIVVYRETPPPPGRGARWAAYGLGALAAAALASTIALAVLAAGNADAVTDGGSVTMPSPFRGAGSETQSAGRVQATLALVSTGVALAAAGGAVGLFLLGRKIDAEAPRLALIPSLAPGGGGLVLAGSF